MKNRYTSPSPLCDPLALETEEDKLDFHGTLATNVKIVDVAYQNDPNMVSEVLDAMFAVLAKIHAEWYQ